MVPPLLTTIHFCILTFEVLLRNTYFILQKNVLNEKNLQICTTAKHRKNSKQKNTNFFFHTQHKSPTVIVLIFHLVFSRTAVWVCIPFPLSISLAVWVLNFKSKTQIYHTLGSVLVFVISLYYTDQFIRERRQTYLCYRPWRLLRLWDIKAPSFSRQSAHMAVMLPASHVGSFLPLGSLLVLISVRGLVNPNSICLLHTPQHNKLRSIKH
jgi:hypothetical protein